MKNIVLKYGLLSGAAVILMMSATTAWVHNSGKLEGGELFGYAGMIISMVFVFVGVRAYRDQQRNGVISFGEAFKVGGLMALITCASYVVGWLIVYEFFMPDFLDQYMTTYLAEMKASGKSELEIQQATEQMLQYKEWYKNPLFRIALTLMEILPVAVLSSVVSAAILRRKSPTADNMSVN